MPDISNTGGFLSSSNILGDAQPTSYLEPMFKAPYEAWKASPGPSTAGALVRASDPVINEAMRTYAGSASESPTLKSKARKLTLQAIKSYDPTRAKFRTHLISQLQGLRRLAAKEEQVINVPEQILLDLRTLKNMENSMKDRLGRDPSDAELADRTGLSRKRIGYIRTLKPSFSEGSLTRIDEEGSSLYQPAVTQSAVPTAMQAWHDFVYTDLDPIDQQIMEYTLAMHGKPELSNQEIARKLRLSPGAISQRKARIQEKLDLYQSTGLF